MTERRAMVLIPQRPRVNLHGVQLDQVALRDAVAALRSFLHAPGCHQVVTVNLDFLTMAERNSKFRQIINEADLAVADGMPLVWASRLKHERLAERVTGVELVHESCRLAVEAQRSVFLLGGGPGIAERAADALRARYPGIEVAGSYSPPVGPLAPPEEKRILEMVNRAKPGFLFVALGAPRQDVWIRAHRHELEASVAMGVGCVLDLLAGVVRRAPRWMQHSGLEWAYRLGQEPNRLWRRYLVNDVPTLGRLVWSAATS
ncbi:MAG TPA: WecB/TagA/CpsF family glycosyltransferase [Chloroflexota bacterium]|nr:WecB/TagA/CpsF family glycosyltransferase [Chloroflexota bacterium]